MNTEYDVPSSLVMEPGFTAYGEPTNRNGTPDASSRSLTASSRREPYGAKSRAAYTADAPTSATNAGITSSGSPYRYTSARPMESSNAFNASHM